MTTRMRDGILQPNGETAVEPTMDVENAGNAVCSHGGTSTRRERALHDCMATKMPFVGRG